MSLDTTAFRSRMSRTDEDRFDPGGLKKALAARALNAETDHRLSNRVFTGCADIVAHCCAAWNDLIDQPWRGS